MSVFVFLTSLLSPNPNLTHKHQFMWSVPNLSLLYWDLIGGPVDFDFLFKLHGNKNVLAKPIFAITALILPYIWRKMHSKFHAR